MVSHPINNQNKIHAKKSLGQNFLHSTSVIDKIVAVSNVTPNDTVIEIGPGKGALTKKILLTGAKVVAIEKDNRLIPYLSETFHKEIEDGALILLHADALNMQIVKNRGVFLSAEYEGVKNKIKINENYKVIANIPYYITGALLRNFFEQQVLPKTVTVLVQKEVADRIVATNEKESILSLSIKFFGNPKKIMNVSKNNFNPKPKVDSAVLFVETKNEQNDKKIAHKFFDLLHRGFGQKRKSLRKNLVESGLPKDVVEQSLSQLNIAPLTRAEDIDFSTWILLANKLY